MFGYPHLASVALWGLKTAASQATIRCGATAADDLQLFFGTVGAVQQLLNKLLQAYLGVGFTRRRLLQELVNLGNLPEGGGEQKIYFIMTEAIYVCSSSDLLI